MTKELVKVQEKNITDEVLNRVNELQMKGALEFPPNYSVGNALKSAYLILTESTTKDRKPVLQACTQESIANSLLDMVVQGLNPSKKQCYFIPYGNKLQLSRSYLGTVALTKRLNGVKDVVGYAIYKDDNLKFDFDFITGKQIIKEYEPSINRNPSDLIGALGLVIGEKGILKVEYMDMAQIKKAWNQGQMKGNSGAHINFTDQMMIKTVINRVCKLYVNTSDDSDKIADAFNRTEESMANTDLELIEELEENANKLELPVLEEETTEDIIEEVESEEQSDSAPF